MAGDIASCGSTGDEATATRLDSLPGEILTLGDNVYESGTSTEFADCFDPSWGRHKARIHPVPGNHDYRTAGATGYYSYFGAIASQSTQGYYSYDLGSWHIIALNSNCGPAGGCGAGSPQEQWLRADLAAHPSTCTLAYWHHPRFSSGTSHGSDATYTALWKALIDNHADVVINGHEHNYERFALQDQNGVATSQGLRQFVVGTGGRSHYGFGAAIANSEVRNATAYGVLQLTLASDSYSWLFVPVAGQTFTDSGTTQCRV